MTNIIIGADISEDHIDQHRQQDGSWQHAADDDKGVAATLEWMGAVERIIYEPTSSSYRAFEYFMLSRSLAVSILNPCKARRFADALVSQSKLRREGYRVRHRDHRTGRYRKRFHADGDGRCLLSICNASGCRAVSVIGRSELNAQTDRIEHRRVNRPAGYGIADPVQLEPVVGSQAKRGWAG